MKMLALIAALLLAASPVAAQQQQQPLGAGGRTNNSTLPRRYLPGTDDRDVLQRGHQPEQWRIWFRWRCRIEQDWYHHAFSGYSALRVVSASQRIMELSANGAVFDDPRRRKVACGHGA